MRLHFAAASLLMVLPLVAMGGVAGGDDHVVIVATLDDVITQGTTIYVQDALAEAEARGAPLLIVLDTPGGLVDATLDIDEALANADVPVLAFVGPRNAFAASAGTFILLMGHPSGMAPGTTIGSAQPVAVGADGSTGEAGEKTENFLVGRIRAIAEDHGRDPDVAERFITENLNLDSDEAQATGIIDVVADDAASFLSAVHGMTARTPGGDEVLDTEGARIVHHDRSLLSRTVDILGNPQIAFLFVLAGTYALIFGLANPGTYVPEVIGAILLVLGFIGIGLFSAGTAGVILLVLALLFFVAEVFTPTHGILSVAGVIAMFFAVLFLVDEPLLPTGFLRRFYFAGIATALVSGGVVLGAVTLALRTRNKPTWDVLRGARGVAIEPVGPDAGRVELHGEVWNARSDEAIPAGHDAFVVDRDGLTLMVRAAAAGPSDDASEE